MPPVSFKRIQQQNNRMIVVRARALNVNNRLDVCCRLWMQVVTTACQMTMIQPRKGVTFLHGDHPIGRF